jgi:hypothetical protein
LHQPNENAALNQNTNQRIYATPYEKSIQPTTQAIISSNTTPSPSRIPKSILKVSMPPILQNVNAPRSGIKIQIRASLLIRACEEIDMIIAPRSTR